MEERLAAYKPQMSSPDSKEKQENLASDVLPPRVPAPPGCREDSDGATRRASEEGRPGEARGSIDRHLGNQWGRRTLMAGRGRIVRGRPSRHAPSSRGGSKAEIGAAFRGPARLVPSRQERSPRDEVGLVEVIGAQVVLSDTRKCVARFNRCKGRRTRTRTAH